ncbi:hypothetical protein BX616_006538 [Lobosporangium transversale]|nr:hypothetical protein BX616_006538 [Lobosporangium transversale]
MPTQSPYEIFDEETVEDDSSTSPKPKDRDPFTVLPSHAAAKSDKSRKKLVGSEFIESSLAPPFDQIAKPNRTVQLSLLRLNVIKRSSIEMKKHQSSLLDLLVQNSPLKISSKGALLTDPQMP